MNKNERYSIHEAHMHSRDHLFHSISYIFNRLDTKRSIASSGFTSVQEWRVHWRPHQHLPPYFDANSQGNDEMQTVLIRDSLEGTELTTQTEICRRLKSTRQPARDKADRRTNIGLRYSHLSTLVAFKMAVDCVEWCAC